MLPAFQHMLSTELSLHNFTILTPALVAPHARPSPRQSVGLPRQILLSALELLLGRRPAVGLCLFLMILYDFLMFLMVS